MNGIEILILIGSIFIIAAGVGYYMNYGQPTLKEIKEIYFNNNEVLENTTNEETQDPKPELLTEQPIKKKRKYYPKKKKTEDK